MVPEHLPAPTASDPVPTGPDVCSRWMWLGTPMTAHPRVVDAMRTRG